ncbi:MAG TPA: hypothetical protein VF615_25590 [Longimicrobiaceae bacterium]|jgi:hypothetical protein
MLRSRILLPLAALLLLAAPAPSPADVPGQNAPTMTAAAAPTTAAPRYDLVTATASMATEPAQAPQVVGAANQDAESLVPIFDEWTRYGAPRARRSAMYATAGGASHHQLRVAARARLHLGPPQLTLQAGRDPRS